MEEWTEIVRAALTQIGGDKVLVPGAKLRKEVERVGNERGTDISAHLRNSGLRFGQFLQTIENLQIHPRPGSDLYVGLEEAKWPDTTQRKASTDRRSEKQIRQDAYQAFTIVSSEPFWYAHRSDEFTQEPDEGEDVVQIPATTRNHLIEDRRAFAESLNDPVARVAILAALDPNTSAQPLKQFRSEIMSRALGKPWHEFKFEKLSSRISTWAADKEVRVSPSWFVRSPTERVSAHSHQVLTTLARYMTESEIRALNIPFRAVEAMYLDLLRRRT